MNRETTRLDYLSRIDRVLKYIHDHLDDDLDLDHLADIACFSHCHWHRIYRGVTGETMAGTVRRLRLHRAAGELIQSSSDIRNIAARAGYGSIEAFSRVFRSAYGEPPARYRDRTSASPEPNLINPKETTMYTTEIKDLEPKRLAAVRHIGDYMKVDEAFQSVIMWGAKVGALKEQPEMIGIYYDDPSAVEVDKLRTDAGIVIDNDMAIEETSDNANVRAVDIAGGRHAVVTFKGPYAELHNGYNWLFTSWLPESGEEAGEDPVFEIYLNDPRSTAPSDLLTNICLPLKG
jgi:AraC family transcriptional regulator